MLSVQSEGVDHVHFPVRIKTAHSPSPSPPPTANQLFSSTSCSITANGKFLGSVSGHKKVMMPEDDEFDLGDVIFLEKLKESENNATFKVLFHETTCVLKAVSI